MQAFLQHPKVNVNILSQDVPDGYGYALIHIVMFSKNIELIKLVLSSQRVNVNIKSNKVRRRYYYHNFLLKPLLFC